MMNPTTERLVFSSVSGKKVTAVFDDHPAFGGDAGVLFLREVEKRIGVIGALTDAIVDSRHPSSLLSGQKSWISGNSVLWRNR